MSEPSTTWDLQHAPGGDEEIGRLAQFRILRLLGRGGMGVVYLAEQDKPQRQVALKVLRSDALSAERLRRFEFEVEVLGRLKHPGIAQIYEAGTADTGLGPQPYFAMELIEGRPLTSYANDHQLSTAARLGLLIKVCQAMEHAHQKGVIHRDLKPGNILVEGAGQPKILDFGLARVTHADVPGTTLGTVHGQLLGTIPYMSPEQVAGDPGQLDTRSDVYTLGVLGYELLAGRLPHPVQGKPVPQALRAISEDEPQTLGSVNRVFRGDLQEIFAKALAKDKSRRYQSASELAADLERYLRDEPVLARPGGAVYRLGKFARRHKGLMAALILIAAGVALAGWLWFSRALAAERAERADKARVLALAENETRLAARQGRWQDAVAASDHVLKLEPADPVQWRLEKIRALFALSDPSSVEEVAALAGRPDLGRHQGSVLLLQGDILLGRSNDQAVALIRQARQAGLGPAEDAYAQGLLADKVPAAVEHFKRVLQLEADHQRARSLLACTLVLSGEFQEARLHVRTAEALFPNDPGPKFVQALSEALEGDLPAAYRTLDRAQEQAPLPQARALRAGLKLLHSLRDWEKEGIETMTKRVAQDLLVLAPQVKDLFPVDAGGSDEHTLNSARLLSLPPVLHNTFGRVFRAFMSPDPKRASEEFLQLADIHPEGFMLLQCGMQLLAMDRDAEAEKMLVRAADAPSLFPVQREALGMAALAAWHVGMAAPQLQKEARSRSLAYIRRLVKLGDIRAGHARHLWNMAAQENQNDLAFQVLVEWKKAAPDDMDVHVAWATVLRREGRFEKALETLAEVLKKVPDHKEAQRNQRLAWLQYRAMVERVDKQHPPMKDK